jgi:NADH dehydrogenase FAD-containing subunit
MFNKVLSRQFIIGRQNAMFMKEVEDGMLVKQRILRQLEHANYLLCMNSPESHIKTALHWVVVGGGPTGINFV